jgi:hypothetical protein
MLIPISAEPYENERSSLHIYRKFSFEDIAVLYFLGLFVGVLAWISASQKFENSKGLWGRP